MGRHKTKAELIDSLDSFTQAYIECALWSSTDNSTESGGYPLDDNYGIEDLTMGALKQMIADCKDFQDAQDAYLLARCGKGATTGQTRDSIMGQSGHDFWLTRNHHGAGFWDRGLGELGDRLTKAAHAYGEAYLTVHRGKIFHD